MAQLLPKAEWEMTEECTRPAKKRGNIGLELPKPEILAPSLPTMTNPQCKLVRVARIRKLPFSYNHGMVPAQVYPSCTEEDCGSRYHPYVLEHKNDSSAVAWLGEERKRRQN
jgi:hypothetical protein